MLLSGGLRISRRIIHRITLSKVEKEEYLRAILADVNTSQASGANLLQADTILRMGMSRDSWARTAWFLKLGQLLLAGIEERLEIFTASTIQTLPHRHPSPDPRLFERVQKAEGLCSVSGEFYLKSFLAMNKEDFGLGHKAHGAVSGGVGVGVKRKSKEHKERCMYRLYAVVVHIGKYGDSSDDITYPALPNSSDIPAAATQADLANLPPPPGSANRSRQWANVSDTVVKLTTLEVLGARVYIHMYERVRMTVLIYPSSRYGLCT
ncbi:hypothetical protein GYMLUDRAFT_264353 [Collybiopsis luxurians FD-317 M1]|uniref:USP domain-containing protein n=1 Tax=Collybiopsis luxurians FD-317 M1 TaxID=944289 RepID=A0A0D0BK41_9AGAR|nr:hypothetical protein GYMLUDRAFT_264353 [Collybiopsis luxurians FD-317 M1]